MSSNHHVSELLDAYLFAALPPDTVQQVDQHLASCENCRAELAQRRELYERLAAMPALEASADLIQQTEDRIAQADRPTTGGDAKRWWRNRTPWERVWFSVAFGFLLLLVPTLYFATLKPSPYDIQVYGQGEWLAGSEVSLRVIVINRNTNQPIENMSLRLTLSDGESKQETLLAEFETDSEGTGQPRFQVPRDFGKECRLSVTAKTWGADPEVERWVKLHHQLHRVIVNTDKPLYQPGQTIHARALALSRPEGTPVAGEEAVFTIHDPKGNRILRRRSESSQFGIASVNCPLASELIEGEYRIECQVGESSTETRVEVKRYQLPKLKATATFDRPFYLPGDSIKGEVFAAYTHGRPVTGSDVKITLESDPPQEQTLRTNSEGRATFVFEAPESPQESVRLTGSVVDAAGQEGRFSSVSRLAEEALEIHVLPEAGELVPGVPNKVFLVTTTADKRPARTRLTIKRFNLTLETHAHDGQPLQSPIGRLTPYEEILETNSLGVAVFEFTPDSQTLEWQVTASHESWKSRTKTFELPVRNSQGTDFLVRTDRAVYRGGDKLQISVLSPKDDPVYFDLLHDGQTLLTGSVKPSDGKGRSHVALPERLSGPVQLYAYRLNGDRMAATQSKHLFVQPGKEPTVKTQADRNEYRPGETARMKFTLLDGKGRPVPGAISLAIVDEAVYALSGNVFEPKHALLNEDMQRFQQTFQNIAAWSPEPVAVVSGDRQLFEEALFSALANQSVDPREQLKRQLLPYLDNDERIFEVLERPDWEELIPPGVLPDEARELLKGQGAIHSLKASSYRQDANSVAERKRAGGEFMKGLWVLFAIATVVVWCVWLTRKKREMLLDGLAIVCVTCLLIALLLPSVQQAREAARRSSARNDLKNLEIAFYNFRDEHGEFPAEHVENQSTEGVSPRMREWFPETLLWQPELITDETGQASLDVSLADSITTWRISGGAVTGAGELGAFQSSLRVFQPFFVEANLPLELTQGDQLTLPVVVSNYLEKPQTVYVRLIEADWFSCHGPASQVVELMPNEVQSVQFPLHITKGGAHALEISASAGEVKDAIRRQVTVNYGGRRIEHTASGTLSESQDVPFTIPENTIPGSQQILIKVYPSPFSQTVEGLEGILQRPYGCFEQTSSTLYPNVLVLDYLRRTKQSRPSVEEKAKSFIQTGYQRLLSFEVAGGGFDWFGHPPAHVTLTAYGLMEFEDMAEVYDVDPALIQRTRAWLLAKQQADGSWLPDSHQLHDDPTRGTNQAKLAATAYMAWSVFRNQRNIPEARLAERFLMQHPAHAIEDPYVLALVGNALLTISPDGSQALPYLDRLIALANRSRDGKLDWWSPARQTLFYGMARAADVETTALATLALLSAKRDPAAIRSSLAWLIAQKDQHGTWHTTQATILTLKALLAVSENPLGGDRPSRLEIAIDGESVRTLDIPAVESDLMQQVLLTTQYTSGSHRISLKEIHGTAPAFQVVIRTHVIEQAEHPAAPEGLALLVNHSAKKLRVGQRVRIDAVLKNSAETSVPMVVLELPIAPGFELDQAFLDQDLEAGRIAKYELKGSRCIVYLRELLPETSQTMTYQLQALLPGILHSPAVKAYPYYAPGDAIEAGALTFTVEP